VPVWTFALKDKLIASAHSTSGVLYAPILALVSSLEEELSQMSATDTEIAALDGTEMELALVILSMTKNLAL